MRQMALFSVVAVASAVALGGTVFAQSSDSEIGTWRLNVAKSSFQPGTALKSSTLKFEAAGAGVKITVDQLAADGTVRHSKSTLNYDGKDNPLELGVARDTGNNPFGDIVARTRINATATELAWKKGGNITTAMINAVSRDGKTLISTTTGTNAQGQTVFSVAVYDKQ
jgi:hypothetical protein